MFFFKLRRFFSKKEVTLLSKNEHRVLPPIPSSIHRKYRNLKTELTASSTTKNPFSDLEKIYSFLDSYGIFVKTFSVCSKGCSACCKNDVFITSLEANYIAKKAKISTKKTVKSTSKHSNTPCPFLKNNSCSIYSYRPFNCRTFFTLDNPKYCNTGDSHQIYGVQGGQGIPMIESLKQYTEKLNGKRPESDIRNFF